MKITLNFYITYSEARREAVTILVEIVGAFSNPHEYKYI